MNWFRMIGLMGVATSCTALGMLGAAWSRRRVAELERARAWVLNLTGLLTYTLSTPQMLLCQLLEQPELARLDYFIQARQGLSEGLAFHEAFEKAMERSRLPLDQGDRALLARVGALLGASDLDTQLGQLALLGRQLDVRLDQARTQSDKNTRIAPALGSLLGLALVVLMI